MRIKCSYELANEYRGELKELGFETPGPFLIKFYEPKILTFYPGDYLDMDNTPEILEMFVELVEKGATVEGDLVNEEAMIARVLESLRKLQGK